MSARTPESRHAGFSLIEAMAAVALTATIVMALSSVTGQWLPNWRRGFVDLQRTDLLGVGLERVLDDVSAAEYVTPSANAPEPLFEGDSSSVIFVRSAIGPNSYPHLEIVRLAPGKDDRGPALTRTRASFAPTAPGASGKSIAFGDAVALIRAPFHVSFAYAGKDRVWRDSWNSQQRLPDAVRVTVRDAANRIATSTAVPIKVTAQGVPKLEAQANSANTPAAAPTPAPQAGAPEPPAMSGAATPGAGSEERVDSGFVLVAVLWILAALATLASIYSVYAVNTADGSHVGDDRVQAEASIRAGVEMAVFQQLAVPEKARPSHGAFRLRIGRTKVAVDFRSEAARIDLNAAQKDLLAGLFAAVGVDAKRAGTFADRVIGWRTKANANAAANPTPALPTPTPPPTPTPAPPTPTPPPMPARPTPTLPPTPGADANTSPRRAAAANTSSNAGGAGRRRQRRGQRSAALRRTARPLPAASGAVRQCVGAQPSARSSGVGGRARPAFRHGVQRSAGDRRRQRGPDCSLRAAGHDA